MFVLICITSICFFTNAACFVGFTAYAASVNLVDLEKSFGYGVRVGIIDSGVNAINGNVLEGLNFLEKSTDTTDKKGHGTTIASIISVIAPNAKIIPLKCTELNQINDNSAIITAIYKAVDDFDCDVINVSIGMPDSEELKAAIDYAVNKGAIIVSAVGNDGELSYKASKVYYPAGYENVVGVGSVDENNVASGFSQKNNSVFVVTSSKEQGTSFAAAKISGAAAIAKSFNKQMSVLHFMKYVKEASIDMGNEGYDVSYGNGVLDFELLVKNLKADYPVYITYSEEQKFKLYNSKKETVNGILIFIGNDVTSQKIRILPGEEKEFDIKNSTNCFLWQNNIFNIVWIKKGEW